MKRTVFVWRVAPVKRICFSSRRPRGREEGRAPVAREAKRKKIWEICADPMTSCSDRLDPQAPLIARRLVGIGFLQIDDHGAPLAEVSNFRKREAAWTFWFAPPMRTRLWLCEFMRYYVHRRPLAAWGPSWIQATSACMQKF